MYLFKVEELFKYLLPLSYTALTIPFCKGQSNDPRRLHEETERKFFIFFFLKRHIYMHI